MYKVNDKVLVQMGIAKLPAVVADVKTSKGVSIYTLKDANLGRTIIVLEDRLEPDNE